ncbi:MAG: hypothetical protein AAF571_09155, partial [Verrucomicrobiota bacterium]
MAESYKKRGRLSSSSSWWVISLGLHGLALLVLFLTPAREYLLGPAESQSSQIHVSEDNFRKITEQIDRVQRAAMEEQLEALEQIAQTMEQIRQQDMEQYQVLEQEMATGAREKALAAAEQALAAMRQVREQQQQIEAAAQDWSTADDPVQQAGSITEKLRQTNESYIRVRQALNESASQSGFLDLESLVQLQQQVAQLQQQVEEAQEVIENGLSQMSHAAHQVRARQNQVAAKQRQIDNVQGRIQSFEERQTQQKHQLEQAQSQLATAEGNQRKAFQNRVKQANNRIKQTRQQLQKLESSMQEYQQEKQQLEAQVAAVEEHPTKTSRDAVQQARAVMQKQDQAIAAQQVAIRTLKQMPREQVAASEEEESNAEPSETGIDFSLQRLEQLVATGRQLETRIATEFQTVQAVKSSIRRRVSLQEAMRTTRSTRPEREAVDTAALTQSVESFEHLQQRKEAYRMAGDQLESMVVNGREMLMKIRDTGQNQGMDISLASMQLQAESYAQESQLAAEDGGQRAKDLTEMMRAAAGGNMVQAYQDKKGGLQGASQVPDKLNFNEVKKLYGRRIVSDGDAASTGRWLFVDSWYVIGPFPNPRRSNVDAHFPPETHIDLDARYAGDGGRPLAWEFIKASEVFVKSPNDQP